MAEEILVCLDGSRLAEKILPLAQGIGDAKRSAVVLLRVVGSSEELAVKESYMRERASMLGAPTLGTFLATNSSSRCLCSSISRLLILVSR
jgi:hypothetical protein